MKRFFSRILIFIVLFLGITFHANAQGTSVTLVVTKTNGEELTLQLTEESQLYFENGETLVIEDGTGTTLSFPLAEIQKMVCTEYTHVGENTASGLWLVPNPIRDNFIIYNLQESGPARLYALDGRLVKTFTASEGQIVDISDLVPGMYLLHIDGQILKMMKL